MQYERDNNEGTDIIETDAGIKNGTTSFSITADSEYIVQWGCGYVDRESLRNKNVLWVVCETDLRLPSVNEWEFAKSCFLFIDASLLRKKGALVSHQASWERATADLVKNLKFSPNLKHLLQATGIIITFAEDGVLFLKCGEAKVKSAYLSLSHGNAEGYLRTKFKRNADYTFAVMVAAAAKQLSILCSKEKIPNLPSILRVAKNLMINGYTLGDLQNCHLYNDDYNSQEPESTFRISEENLSDPDNWRIIDNHIKESPIASKAMEFVHNGTNEIKSLPRFEFGKFITFDRFEIEAYQNLYRLINNYVNTKDNKPLSIAVNGTPGTGRSFGIEQIVWNSFPSEEIEILEFSETKLAGLSDLNAAFQNIRELNLDGKLSLVFFEGFGANRCEWQECFDMPVREGIFVDGSGKHKLGKCIFVFIDDTSEGSEDNAKPTMPGSREEPECPFHLSRPDFVSGLSGVVGIIDINPKVILHKEHSVEENENFSMSNAKTSGDRSYVLKRALILRSLCEEGNYTIDPSVVWTMLHTSRYKHGVRSMRSVYEMCRIEKGRNPSVFLPSETQLSLHVEDAAAFVSQVERMFHFNMLIDVLAQYSHEMYCDVYGGRPWNELSDEMKDSNKAQVTDIPSKLEFIGCDFDYQTMQRNAVERFNLDERDELAKAEHGRWMDEKRANDWTYAPERDDAKKQNPLMVEWADLSDDERKKDYVVVENIIALLKRVDLDVYRIR
ncbi:MAG: RyR domain-containing protein [Eubacteriaceae bacterium]|nr:RyR domain-containing protein [Eubacteriaceae bacterium]